MVQVRAATLLDVIKISVHIRQSDVDEVFAATGRDIMDELVDSYKTSTVCWIAHESDELIAVLGVSPTDHPQYGIPWMLATDKLYENKKSLVRLSREIVSIMHTLYPILTNFVDERNTDSINYLKWLGFEFPQRLDQYGYEGRPFWQFIRKKYV